ncbi:MobH family relaxase [Ralstonia sp. 1138]|uniref:MobH family relaxase n=1 Tax=Ralstonia sp. 1138 TaxID=3156423 RepID=UPI003397EF98
MTSNADWLGAAAALSLAGAAWLTAKTWRPIWRARPGAVSARSPERKVVVLRQGQLPVLDGKTLMQAVGMQGTLQRIRANAGLSTANFERDMLPVIERVAQFVQQLPASESHHHAQPGGLLVHMLEVTDAALRIRRGRILPKGAPIEMAARLEHRWTYGVFLAAMLHDIGRPMADVRVTMFRTPDAEGGPWIPLTGSMAAHGALAYTVAFPLPAERDYGAHRRLPIVLMQQLVPQAAMLWLAADPELIRQLNAFLSGEADPSSPIAEIVTAADRESVAANLRYGPRTRFRTARAVPLIERLMQALRRMLLEGLLPINQTGFSAGWSDGEALWLVPKTVADAVREYLKKHEIGEGAGAGIPTDNNRLFDTWQEYGAVIPNATGGALWNIHIESKHNGKALNALRFRLDVLYAQADAYPKPFEGRIRILGEGLANAVEPETASPCADAIEVTCKLASPPEAAQPHVLAAADTHLNGAESAVDCAKAQPVSESLQLSSEPTRESVPAASKGRMRTGPVDFKRVLAQTVGEVGEVGADPLTQTTALAGPVNPYASVVEALADAPMPLAAQFMAWLQAEIAQGILPFNRAGSPVHFVGEGMLLVSPAIFRLFQQKAIAAGAVDIPDGDRGYVAIQSALIKSRLALESGKKDFLHVFVVDHARRTAKLTCLLIPAPQRWFDPLPPPNPILRRFDPERDREDHASSPRASRGITDHAGSDR